MPLHMTRWVLDRLSQRWFAGVDAHQTSDTTFVDFVNILQHRMIALFYRAWADAHPGVQVERAVGGRIRSMLEAMAGIGLPGTHNSENPDLDAVKLRQAAALASQVDGPERLTLFVAEAFKVPVQLKEFVATWMTMPKALQSQLGKEHATLGRSATIGPRTFSRQSRVELRIGPLGFEDFTTFPPRRQTAGHDETGCARPCRRFARCRSEDRADSETPCRGPRSDKHRLGRTAWLARPPERGDAEDMRLQDHRWMATGDGGSGGMSLLLTLEQGPRAQAVRQARLDKGELVIGRSPEADWQIDDPDMFVSRAHCKVVGGEDGYFVTDMSSSGLFIDDSGSPLGSGNSARLQNGMRLRMGDYVLWVDLQMADAQPAAPEPAYQAAQPASRTPVNFGHDDFFSVKTEEEPARPRPANLPDPFEQPEAGAFEPRRRPAELSRIRRSVQPRPGGDTFIRSECRPGSTRRPDFRRSIWL